MEYPTRVQAGVLAAAALSLWGAIQYYVFEDGFQKQARDPYQVAAQQTRFAGVRDAVPADAVLGYVTDLEPGSSAAAAAFSGAQYALAPRLVRSDTDAAITLGNFAHPADFAAIGRQHGLRIEHDLGSGVVLFRKEGR